MNAGWIRLAAAARPEPAATAVLVALVLIGVAFEALLPWPLKLVLDHVLPGKALPGAAAWVVALPGAGSAPGLIAWLAGGLVALFLAGQAVQLVRAALQAGLSARMQYRVATAAFDTLQQLSLVYHARARRGDLVHRVAVDSGCMPTLVTGVAVPLLTALFTLGVLAAIMWQLDPLLAAIAAGMALPMGLLMRWVAPKMTERAHEQQRFEGDVWSVAEQTLGSLPLVQAFAREEHERLRFGRVSHRTVQATMRLTASQLQFKVGVDGMIALGTAAVMMIGGWRALQGAVSLGTLVVFLSYLTALYAPMVTLAFLSPVLAGAAASGRRVLEVLDASERVREAPHARPLPRPPRGHVCLESIVFGYEPGRPILNDVSMELLPGETVALVGATGAGKSSLVSLIPRLADPWQGRVLLDGHDVRTATLASVRALVALVPQEPFLLPLSIAENIAYGRPGASREAIVAAATAAQADAFIRRLPQGYDTPVGERGATLSGGERQRLAIARALLKDAPILILDEPTSALDAETERALLAAFETLMRGRTCLVIAHRLSTVRKAARIVALDAGRIREVPGAGRHEAGVNAARSG